MGYPSPVCPTPGLGRFPLSAEGGEDKQQEGDGSGRQTAGRGWVRGWVRGRAPSPKMGGKNLGQPEFTDETKLRESSKQGGSESSEA